MHPCKGFTSAYFDSMEDIYHIQFKDKLLGQDWLELYTTDIRYQWTGIKDVVGKQRHLMAWQKADPLNVLKQNKKLLNGSLGVYPHCKVHIDINPDAKPVHMTISHAFHSFVHIHMWIGPSCSTQHSYNLTRKQVGKFLHNYFPKGWQHLLD